MIKNIKYPFELWMTSVVFGTALFIVILELTQGMSQSLFDRTVPILYIFYMLFCCAASIPAFLALWVSYHILLRYHLSKVIFKVVLIVICAVYTFLTLWLMPVPFSPLEFDGTFYLMMAAYLSPLIIGILWYRSDAVF
jgi:hypothetical protein